MSTMTLWTLPTNPPTPPENPLLDLTPELNGRLYYTKTIVDIVGELTVTRSRKNVREWTIPPALIGPWPGSYFIGRLTFGPGGLPWFSLPTPERLVEFNPNRGGFTAYEGKTGKLQHPRNLMFDQRGNLLFTGWYIQQPGQPGHDYYLIGRLDRSRERVDLWPLPLDIEPNDIWVDADGAVVWIAFARHVLKPGPFLGALVSSTSRLVYWWSPPGTRPVGLGIAGDRPKNPENIWITYDPGIQGKAAAFRFHVKSDTVYVYSMTANDRPSGIATDVRGNAWIGHQSQRVSSIERSADCGWIAREKKTVCLRPRRVAVRVIRAGAKPRLLQAASAEYPVTRASRPCITDFALPIMWSPRIQVSGGQQYKPKIYFTHNGSNRIGQLTP